ncbi:MAG: hypothetical protein R2852_03845 [Bacteroidia bacterium]
MKSNKYDDARESLYPLTTTENPYRTEATYYYGYCSYMEKDYNKALLAFKMVENKNIGAVQLYIAEIYYLKDDHQKAIDYASGKTSVN